MTETLAQSRRRPLPVTIVPGMTVVDMTGGSSGVVAGVTETYCIYRLTDHDELCVARWRNLALANVCPAEPLLPADVVENDRRNASAALLRELLAMRRISPLSHQARDHQHRGVTSSLGSQSLRLPAGLALRLVPVPPASLQALDALNGS